MYVMIQHSISDPAAFWGSAEQMLPQMPPTLKLHQSFPNKDGSKAVCVWEADSIEALRGFIEPTVGRVSRNEYFEVVNREGVAMPAAVATARAPA